MQPVAQLNHVSTRLVGTDLCGESLPRSAVHCCQCLLPLVGCKSSTASTIKLL